MFSLSPVSLIEPGKIPNVENDLLHAWEQARQAVILVVPPTIKRFQLFERPYEILSAITRDY
jgi:hypothetical protein